MVAVGGRAHYDAPQGPACSRGEREGIDTVIQNFLGILTGAIVALLALIIGKADSFEQYVTALVIGGIANFAWPLVAAILVRRRVKARRADQIQSEVDKQMASQNKR